MSDELKPWQLDNEEAEAFRSGLAQESLDAIADNRDFNHTRAAWNAANALASARVEKLERAREAAEKMRVLYLDHTPHFTPAEEDAVSAFDAALAACEEER